ncbi:pyridoxal 5'-phosphate synthase glutaminase subunit PdxT [Candidatus Acetothermia bacterium]|jgi:5'-phosphate synthase pdxT subunit|nr:pyridoxal 5'-phosphate synthase glutaminase subunit PdxT [Candidatus Acetothermia bacterium]MCI2432558.1 pyridoxal 5'-phosphate synthase glutaminase subunit PdxT [Candidatus Acetothermia bacterium]MCI2435865.1 pyridoxal 5'-phosphate synthase glutaminase subunit PdxT [Candidatus Acetothermia bacterium]
MHIGVLALQGDFREHLAILRAVGLEVREVRTLAQLEGVDGLIIPGGESTTMAHLLMRNGLMESLRRRGRDGLPIYGTCAGMILLAQELEDDRPQERLNLMGVTVRRNAYGRQLDSFEADLQIKHIGAFHAVFIRAPKIVRVRPSVEILAEHDGTPVLVRQKNLLASSFHPELTGDSRVHQYFLEMVARR